MLIVVMDDQGGGMYIGDRSTATFVDLSMNDNTAPNGPDMQIGGATVSCETPCTAGEYGQCDSASTDDENFQCPINCNVSST